MSDPREAHAVEYVRTIVVGLIAKPDALVLTPRLDSLGLTIEVTADDADERLIVGRQGLIIEAIRRIMTIWGKTNNARVNVYVPKRQPK